MDPFTGLGSSAIACARLGLNFIGAEIDEAYLTEAVTRTRVAVIDQAMGGGRAARRARVASIEPPARAHRR
jgi:site-specific DNA-methyltransferase (adenine-specific)